MQAIQMTAIGEPSDVLHTVDLPEPSAPRGHQALIQVEYAPINPSDLLLARGTYPLVAALPATVGNEGVGTVIAIGPDVHNIRIGDTVLIPFGTYAWVERVLAPAESLFVLEPGTDLQQASMLSINPPTAGLLLDQFASLSTGSWVVQNAGNSGVGRSVIAMARAAGIRTISIVRRAALVDEVEAAGGDVVVVDSDTAVDSIVDRTDGAPIALGLDGVGGSATARLAQIVTAGATVINYANMSGQPVVLPTDYLSSKNVTLRGFFMYRPEFLPLHAAHISTAAQLQRKELLTYPIAAIYSPAQIIEALQHAGAGGKVLLDFHPTRALRGHRVR